MKSLVISPYENQKLRGKAISKSKGKQKTGREGRLATHITEKKLLFPVEINEKQNQQTDMKKVGKIYQ